MKRRGVLPLMFLAGFALWIFLSTRAPPPGPAAIDADAGVAEASAPPPALPPNELPRPKAPVVAAAPAGAGSDAAVAPSPPSVRAAFQAAAAQRPRGPVDKRGGNNPRAAEELEIISYAFETLDDDIDACLSEWARSNALAPQQVMLGFEIDASGLQRSWVDSDADGGVPFGVRTCFANAVYGLDWSHVVEQPAKITHPFSLGDAGS